MHTGDNCLNLSVILWLRVCVCDKEITAGQFRFYGYLTLPSDNNTAYPYIRPDTVCLNEDSARGQMKTKPNQ